MGTNHGAPRSHVRQAALSDVDFVDNLQLKETDCVGFLPAQIWEPAILSGRVLIVTINDEPAGYLLRGPLRPVTKVYQCVVQTDARRIENGCALVSRLRDDANRAKVERLSLHCAEDLEANKFWPAIGWQHVGSRDRRGTRGRVHLRYQIDLHAHYQMDEALRAELHGDQTLKILDLFGVKDQFLAPVKKRLRARR